MNEFLKVRAFFIRHPEGWAWIFSLFIWVLFLKGQLFVPPTVPSSGAIIYCSPTGQVQEKAHGGDEDRGILKEGVGWVNWVLMVIAMMFPLLNEPIRHVAFSVRRRDRMFGIFWFLFGYTIVWTAVGALALLLQLFLKINATFFLLAAALIWFPDRAIQMTRCSQTMPIRIQGRELHSDSLLFGLKIGLTCLKLCWAPMMALSLAHHNLIVMCLVTIVLIFERYLVPHTSKLPGVAWGMIALLLFSTEL